MEIYVVKPGDTLYEIAQRFGVSEARLASDNELAAPAQLVPGQTLVILTPNRVHTVQSGESLLSIAQSYGVSVNQLQRNNPQLGGGNTLYPGQTLVIDYQQAKQGTLSVNGYVYPFVDRRVLIKTLPYLTYITLFTYGITPTGELVDLDDADIIRIARDYGVAPLMHLSTLTEEGNFSNELAHIVLNDQAVQDRLIDNILANLQRKNYYGLDVDFEFVLPEDRIPYVTFIRNLRTRLSPEGYPVLTALAPKTSSDQPGLLYEGHDYQGIGRESDFVLLMTYEWGYTFRHLDIGYYESIGSSTYHRVPSKYTALTCPSITIMRIISR